MHKATRHEVCPQICMDLKAHRTAYETEAGLLIEAHSDTGQGKERDVAFKWNYLWLSANTSVTWEDMPDKPWF